MSSIADESVSALDPSESSYSEERHTVGSALENIFQWLAGIVAAYKKATERSWRQEHPPSDITAQSRNGAATGAEGEGIIAGRHVAGLSRETLHAKLVAVDAKIDQVGQVDGVAIPPDDLEIQRRRDLVRTLFNDFWSGFDNKPASFADRLDQAEAYLNERLTACGEFWRLDAKTRKLLGLPPSSNLQNGSKGASRR
jgi:hypothetical protein